MTFSRSSARPDHPILDLPSIQRRIIIAGWATYAIYYLGRLNLSAALSVFEDERNLTGAQTGLIFTGYFWSYAIAALIVGHLSDRIPPARFLAGGLLVSGLINLAFPSIESLWALVTLWSLNELAQARCWTPGLKIVASVLDPQRASRVASIYGTSFVVGTSISWALAGILADKTVGFAYVAFLVWTPTYFTQVNGLSSQRAGVAAATLPLISLVVINRISRVQRRTNSDRDLRGLTVMAFTTSALLGMGALVVGTIKESFGWSPVSVSLGVAALVAAVLLTPLSRAHTAAQPNLAVP